MSLVRLLNPRQQTFERRRCASRRARVLGAPASRLMPASGPGGPGRLGRAPMAALVQPIGTKGGRPFAPYCAASL